LGRAGEGKNKGVAEEPGGGRVSSKKSFGGENGSPPTGGYFTGRTTYSGKLKECESHRVKKEKVFGVK